MTPAPDRLIATVLAVAALITGDPMEPDGRAPYRTRRLGQDFDPGPMTVDLNDILNQPDKLGT